MAASQTVGASPVAAAAAASSDPPQRIPTAESVYADVIIVADSAKATADSVMSGGGGSPLSNLASASTTTITSTRLSPSAKPPLPQRKSTASRKRRILRDPDRELINENRTRQQRYKEESRLQTASNVYRALVGNVLICGAKFAAWLSSGSSALMAEFIHSLVDCGNQALLLVGLRNSNLAADRKHPYGYGKSVYFWALVSALGTFFLGAGVSMSHALQNLFHPSLQEITTEVWGVLVFSFTVDGYVLNKTIRETMADRPKGMSYSAHLANVRDPATLAILLEDGAACLGVVMALGGIVASHYTANPIYDAVAGVGISALLGAMGLTLVRVNHRFLLGQGVDKEITDDIERILLSRRSIDSIGSVQSQWTGPETFSYKAEVDFDGTFLAAKLLPIYQQEFLQIRDTMDDELQVLLALYTEDVMRTVEREVRHVEALIRKRHPGAEYIELEPMSIHADHLAINDNLEDELRRVESDALDRYLRTLKKEGSTVAEEPQPPGTTAGTRTS
jgi:solute carrier family 30 (zinc transporter), member 9